MLKTVNYETLKKALIKCLGQDGEKISIILDKCLSVNGEWYWPNAETLFTKVNNDLYKVKGNFAKDYLRWGGLKLWEKEQLRLKYYMQI